MHISLSIVLDFKKSPGCVLFSEYEVVGLCFQESSNWLCCPESISIVPIFISTLLRLGNCLVLSCSRLWQWMTFSYLLVWLIMTSQDIVLFVCVCDLWIFHFCMLACVHACAWQTCCKIGLPSNPQILAISISNFD